MVIKVVSLHFLKNKFLIKKLSCNSSRHLFNNENYEFVENSQISQLPCKAIPNDVKLKTEKVS